MSPRRSSSSVASIVVVALLALLSLVAGASGASAESGRTRVDLGVTFENLLPGQFERRTAPVRLAALSRVSTVRLVHQGREGAVRWLVQLCPDAGGACTDLQGARDGVLLAAGSYSLVVGVTAVTLAPGEVSSIVGRVVFTRSGTGALASTGSDGVATLAALAAAALSAGFFFLLVARRRRLGSDDPC